MSRQHRAVPDESAYTLGWSSKGLDHYYKSLYVNGLNYSLRVRFGGQAYRWTVERHDGATATQCAAGVAKKLAYAKRLASEAAGADRTNRDASGVGSA